MAHAFNPQILVEKLAKLNSSQASIETLSHWCIFHMNKAKYVVETWEKQFHCAPREQRLPFLYLANDILQNSRRKGSDFVGEFWKVLPITLSEVIQNGDETGRNAALRLISIWEERKVFGPRMSLRDEFLRKETDMNSMNGKQSSIDKLISGYNALQKAQTDSKCKNALACIGKPEDEKTNLEETRVLLKESLQQLVSLESLRSNIVFLLKEAASEEEQELEHLRSQMQAAQTRLDAEDNLPQKNEPMATLACNGRPVVTEKLTESTSSAEKLSLVLSSFARSEAMADGPAEKRARIEGDQPYIPIHVSNLMQFQIAEHPGALPASPPSITPTPAAHYVPYPYILHHQPHADDYSFA